MSVIYLVSAFLVCCTTFYIARCLLIIRRVRKFAAANGCQPAPRTGSVAQNLNLLWRIIRIHKTGEDLLDLIGPGFKERQWTIATYKILGIRPSIETADPKNVQAVLATNFKDYEAGSLRATSSGSDIFGKRSIFLSDGAAWEHSRALLRPQFARTQINDLRSTETAVQALLERLDTAQDGPWTKSVDLMPLFFDFTLDTATTFLFGESVGRLSRDIDEAREGAKFANAFEVVQSRNEAHEIMRRLLNPWSWVFGDSKTNEAIKEINDFAKRKVRAAASFAEEVKHDEAEAAAKDHGARDSSALVDRLLRDDAVSEDDIQSELLALLFAGRDTTASFLSWIFIALAQNPPVFAKLRAEIIQTLGNSVDSISFSSLKSCRYLQYVLQESLRFFNVIPANIRIAIRDTILPTGGGEDGTAPIALSKKTAVVIHAAAVHLRKDIWGPDAESFRPDRWEGRKFGWDFIPFSGGPRICIGQQYALTEAAYLLARILQEYDEIDGSAIATEPSRAFALTNFPRDGVKLRLRKAT